MNRYLGGGREGSTGETLERRAGSQVCTVRMGLFRTSAHAKAQGNIKNDDPRKLPDGE